MGLLKVEGELYMSVADLLLCRFSNLEDGAEYIVFGGSRQSLGVGDRCESGSTHLTVR